jgi:hypothetical protein
VAPTDGLLVLDVSGNGVIDDGSELFGSGTILADGSHAADGFIALKAQDSNGDLEINAQDASFSALAVWVDANSDGVSQTGELKSLASLGIESLNLNAAATQISNNGNLIGLLSSYTTTDGVIHQLADVWLQSAAAAAPAPSAAPASVATPPAAANVTPALPPLPLRDAVAGLTQSLSSYEQGQGDARVSSGSLAIPAVVNMVVNSVALAARLSAFIEQNAAAPAGLPTTIAVVPPIERMLDSVTLASSSTLPWADQQDLARKLNKGCSA